MALEIIMAPYDVFWAPVGEAFPVVEVTPAGNWLVLGKTLAERTNEDGVTVTLEQEFEEFRAAGTSGPIEASRTSESQVINLTIHDLVPNMLRLVLNQNAVTSNAAGGGFAGYDEIDLYRGPGKPNEVALLVRGTSGQFAGNAQYEIPRCYVSSNPELAYTKGVATGIEMEFRALMDSAAPFFGRYLSQDEAVA